MCVLPALPAPWKNESICPALPVECSSSAEKRDTDLYFPACWDSLLASKRSRRMKRSICSSKSSVCSLLGWISCAGICEQAGLSHSQCLGSSLLMPGMKFLQHYHGIYVSKVCGDLYFQGGGRGTLLIPPSQGLGKLFPL